MRHEDQILNIVTVCNDDMTSLEKTLHSIDIANYGRKYKVRSFICNSSRNSKLHDFKLLFRNLEVNIASENDSGIYEAMNRGLYEIQSGYVLFLNSGDTFAGLDSLEIIFSALALSNSSIYQFQTVLPNGNLSPSHAYSRRELFFGRKMHAHPSFIFRREDFPNVEFDEDYRIAADYKFVLTLLQTTKITFVPSVITLFEGGGISEREVSVLSMEMARIRTSFGNRFNRIFIHVWNRYFSWRLLK